MIRALGCGGMPELPSLENNLEEENRILKERFDHEKTVREMNLTELGIISQSLINLRDGAYLLGQRIAIAALEKGYSWREDSCSREMHPHARIYADILSRYREINELAEVGGV